MLSRILFCLLLLTLTGLLIVTWSWRNSLYEYQELRSGVTSKNSVENVRHRFLDDETIEVSWDAPIGDDNAVDHYTIGLNSNGNVISEYETTNLSLKLDNLEFCTVYDLVFNAYARDTHRNTKYKPVDYRLTTLTKNPGQPSSLMVNATNDTVQWRPPSVNSHCLRGYNLRFFHDDMCIKDIVLPQDVVQYEISDINWCSQYEVKLYSIGDENSRSMAVVTTTGVNTIELRNTTFVENGRYDVISSEEVLLKWDSPQSSDRCVHHFVISFSNASGLQMLVTNKTELLISGLNACSQYRFTIGARTMFKENIGKSYNIMVKTSAFIPDKIMNLHASSAPNGSVTLSWTPPQVNSNCVNVYRVRRRADYLDDLIITTTNFYASMPVKPCVRYLFDVSAINDEDTSGEAVETEYYYIPDDHAVNGVNFTEEKNGLAVRWRTSAVQSECTDWFKVDICALDYDVPCRTYKPYENAGQSELYVFIPDIVACVTYKISISVVDFEKQFAYYSEIYRSNVRVFDKPVPIDFTDLTSHSANIRWNLTDLSKNRCPLSYTKLECVDQNKLQKLSTLINTTRSGEIKTASMEMIPFTHYSCTLTLFNQAGKSAESDPITFSTTEDVPSLPASIAATCIEDDRVNVVWKPPAATNGIIKEYRLEIANTRLLYETPSWCQFKGDFLRSFILPANKLDTAIDKLNPFAEYSVSVSAASGVGFGESAQMTIVTNSAAPDVVSQPQFTSTSVLSYTITWGQPCRANGKLKSFNVSVIGKRDDYDDDVFSFSVNVNSTNADQIYVLKLPKLRPVYVYNVEISALAENVTQKGVSKILTFLTPTTTPPAPSYEALVRQVQPEVVPGNNGSQVKLTLTKSMFDDSAGPIKYYAIVVGMDILQNSKEENGVLSSPNDWPPMNNWASAYDYDFVFNYEVTPPFWNPFDGKTMNDSVVFVIGEQSDCEKPSERFCNGPLKENTKYILKIRAFTTAGYQDSPPMKFSTGSETPYTARTNCILVICILLLLAFVVCGLYYVKSGHIPLLVEVRERMNGKKKLTVISTRTISISKFAEYHAKLQASPHILKIEFNELTEISAKFNLTDNVAKRYDNYRKNRYFNVVPYDETRVKIQGEKGDYINASFIEGYGDVKNSYIACQGPLVETFADFWTMIVQYKIDIIIMLCQVLENKRVVCEKYFPDVNQTVKFDGISVECTLFTSTSLYEERKIVITKDNKESIVSHIKFLEWPDFGIPANPQILVEFCHGMRKRFTDNPVVVHCSAGVGRTGTFIACDILLQHLPKSKSVNIFNTVLKLRKQRPNMVQSLPQYTFLYDCVAYGIKKMNIQR